MLSPTVILHRNFNVSEDAVALCAALKDIDEQAIIDILTARANDQRQEIATYFLTKFGRILIEDLKNELSGKFKDAIVALMHPPVDFLCEQLHKALSGLYTKKTTLVEILCTKTNAELKEIAKVYKIMYQRPLVEHLCSKASGSFGHLLTLIVDPASVGEQAEENFSFSVQSEASFFASRLYKAMKGMRTDDTTLIRIIVSRSEIDLNDIKREYNRMFNRTLLSAVKSATSGHYRRALCALIGGA